MSTRVVPPIPAQCEHRPTTPDGLVIPMVQVILADGGVDFRARHTAKLNACWWGRLCQVCGGPLRRPLVLFGTDRQIEQMVFDEAPLHPECAHYTVQACPMVGGRQARYATGPSVSDRSRGKACATPGCNCGGWVSRDGRSAVEGTPARPWFAVYARDFLMAQNPDGEFHGGHVPPHHVIRVRQISAPVLGEFHPWRAVPDWLDRYTPPATRPATSVGTGRAG